MGLWGQEKKREPVSRGVARSSAAARRSQVTGRQCELWEAEKEVPEEAGT